MTTEQPVAAGNLRPVAREIALATVSASVVACQIALMQILASIVWYHFAYLIVSFALLGFGLSGTLLAFRGRISTQPVAVLSALCALGMVASVAVLKTELVRLDLYEVFATPMILVSLVLYLAILLVPFTTGALVIALLLLDQPERAGRTYALNLTAAAMGALLGPGLLGFLNPEAAMTLCAAGPAIGAVIALNRRNRRQSGAVTGLLTLSVVLAAWPGTPFPSAYKDISRILALPEARIDSASPSSAGIVKVITAPALRYNGPLSLTWSKPTPHVRAVTLNGDVVATVVDSVDRDSLADLFAYTPEGVVVELLPPGPVWLLEPETNLIGTALDPTSERLILAVDHRAQVAESMRATTPGVQYRSTGSREFLVRASGEPAWIRLPPPTSLSGSAGLGALGEQPLFTRQAIGQAWSRLTPGGLLSVTVAVDHPPRAAPRLARTLMAGIQTDTRAGGAQSLLGIRTFSSITFLARRGGFDPAQVNAIRQFCAKRGFDPIASLQLIPERSELFHRFGEDSGIDRIQSILEGASSPPSDLFSESPPSDSRPYFSQFLRWNRIHEYLGTIDWRNLAYLELGLPIVLTTLVLVAVPGLVLSLLPLLSPRSRPSIRGSLGATLAYAASIGFGFILVEVGLIQSGTAMTGDPVTVAARVIAVLLLAAGAGSYVAGRIGLERLGLVYPPLAVAAWLTLFLALPSVSGLQPDLYPVSPFTILLAVAAGAGFLMGMPFPSLLARLGKIDRRLLPWAWAVNGFLSVIGAPIAVLLAVLGGFGYVFLTAAAAYVVAGLSAKGVKRQKSNF